MKNSKEYLDPSPRAMIKKPLALTSSAGVPPLTEKSRGSSLSQCLTASQSTQAHLAKALVQEVA
ncbi:MAG: hypothetical protein Q8M68_04325 [Polaromonas sp.]|nr:hypothetical protein [Polaromonas sp.]